MLIFSKKKGNRYLKQQFIILNKIILKRLIVSELFFIILFRKNLK